jgi:predicted O-methyltransferase YrrM
MTERNSLHRIKRSLMRYRALRFLHFGQRTISTWSNYIWPNVRNWLVWLFKSREDSNFTYALTERCRLNLVAGLSTILRTPPDIIENYMKEVQEDSELNQHLSGLHAAHPEQYRTDQKPHVGRRMVWYAIVRTLKPAVVVETGVDQGMGAVVLCAALRRNGSEGHEGRYFGTDINPAAGYFLQGEYAKFGRVLYGDSLKSLETLDKIDVFINDSDHSPDYEQAEYELVRTKLTAGAVILGDNSHVTSKLAEFSMRNGRDFIFMAEEPAAHWYRGVGVGVSMPSRWRNLN